MGAYREGEWGALRDRSVGPGAARGGRESELSGSNPPEGSVCRHMGPDAGGPGGVREGQARASISPAPWGQSLRWKQAGGPGWGSGLLVRPVFFPPQGLRSLRPTVSPPCRDPPPSLPADHPLVVDPTRAPVPLLTSWGLLCIPGTKALWENHLPHPCSQLISGCQGPALLMPPCPPPEALR